MEIYKSLKLIISIKYLIIISIAILFSFNSEKKLNGKLRLNLEYCKLSNDKIHINDIRIFKDDIFFKNIEWHKRQNLFELPYGKYEIKYETIYNILETVKFTIDYKEETIVVLCLDKLNYNANKNLLLIDKLNKGEKLFYHYESRDCIGILKDTLELYKKDDKKYILNYGAFEGELSNSQINLIREFEIE
jgi:hypothetical protein